MNTSPAITGQEKKIMFYLYDSILQSLAASSSFCPCSLLNFASLTERRGLAVEGHLCRSKGRHRTCRGNSTDHRMDLLPAWRRPGSSCRLLGRCHHDNVDGTAASVNSAPSRTVDTAARWHPQPTPSDPQTKTFWIELPLWQTVEEPDMVEIAFGIRSSAGPPRSIEQTTSRTVQY